MGVIDCSVNLVLYFGWVFCVLDVAGAHAATVRCSCINCCIYTPQPLTVLTKVACLRPTASWNASDRIRSTVGSSCMGAWPCMILFVASPVSVVANLRSLISADLVLKLWSLGHTHRATDCTVQGRVVWTILVYVICCTSMHR